MWRLLWNPFTYFLFKLLCLLYWGSEIDTNGDWFGLWRHTSTDFSGSAQKESRMGQNDRVLLNGTCPPISLLAVAQKERRIGQNDNAWFHICELRHAIGSELRACMLELYRTMRLNCRESLPHTATQTRSNRAWIVTIKSQCIQCQNDWRWWENKSVYSIHWL